MGRTDLCWGADFDEAFSGHKSFNAAEEIHAYQMKSYLTEETQEIGVLFPDAWIFADSPATADELKEFVRLIRNDESVQEQLAELQNDFEV